MAGKDSVALILDSRFGTGTSLVNVQARHVLLPPSSWRQQQQQDLFLVALQGLQGDVLQLEHELTMAMQHGYVRASIAGTSSTLALPNGQGLLKSSTISPRSLASWTRHLLYQRKNSPYYVEPMIVGLEICFVSDDNGKMRLEHRPYLCSMDMLGSMQELPSSSSTGEYSADTTSTTTAAAAAFCCMGAAATSLYGTAQAFWKPNLEATELAQVCTRAFLAALERDSLSGYGARLYMITPQDGITIQDVLTRND